MYIISEYLTIFKKMSVQKIKKITPYTQSGKFGWQYIVISHVFPEHQHDVLSRFP